MTGPRGPHQGHVSDMLPAGRELDTLVRDVMFGPWDESRCRVCGWKIVPDGARGCWKDNCSMRFPDGMRPPRADAPRPYSTDIAAAWEIVEKLNAADRWPIIQFGPSEGGDEMQWCVQLVNPADVEANAETAPLAICRAALTAVETL